MVLLLPVFHTWPLPNTCSCLIGTSRECIIGHLTHGRSRRAPKSPLKHRNSLRSITHQVQGMRPAVLHRVSCTKPSHSRDPCEYFEGKADSRLHQQVPSLSRPLPAVARLRGGPLPPSGPAGDSRLLSATHLPAAGCRADTDLPFYFLLKGWISRFFTPYESISEPRSSTGCLNSCCSCSWGMMM